MDASAINELKAVLDLYMAQYNATDKLWTYFSTVTLAVIGFSIASDKVSKSFLEASIVAIGYFVFCLANFKALRLSQLQLEQFADIARQVADSHHVGLSTLTPFSAAELATFYWPISITVCMGILLITYRRLSKRAGEQTLAQSA